MQRGNETGSMDQNTGKEQGTDIVRDGQVQVKSQFVSGSGGNCVCPECGYGIAHERGQPCYQKYCPKCGMVLIRG